MIKKVVHDDIAVEANSPEEAKQKAEFLLEKANGDYTIIYPEVGFDSEEVQDTQEIEKPDENELKSAKENTDKIEEIKEQEADDGETLSCTLRGCIRPQVADGEFCEEHIK